MKTAIVGGFLGVAALMLVACGTPEKTTEPTMLFQAAQEIGTWKPHN